MNRKGKNSRRFLLVLWSLLFFWGFFFWQEAALSASWDLSTLITHYLKTRYPWSEIEVLETDGEERVAKEKPVHIQMLQGPLGRAVFSLGFSSGERVLVTATIRALDWAVLTRRPLKRGQVLEEEDLYLALTDVRKMPKGTLNRTESAWGKVLTRSLAANTLLTETDIKEPPTVKKGQKVILFAASPGLRITTTAEAGEDGYPGKQIRVFHTETRKTIKGTVVDERFVRVDF